MYKTSTGAFTMSTLILLPSHLVESEYIETLSTYLCEMGIDHLDTYFKQADTDGEAHWLIDNFRHWACPHLPKYKATLDFVLTFKQSHMNVALGCNKRFIGPLLGRPVWSEEFLDLRVIPFYDLKFIAGCADTKSNMPGYLRSIHRKLWGNREEFNFYG